MEEEKQGTPDNQKKKKESPRPGRFSTVHNENPFANSRSKCLSFFADGNNRPSYASCKNCGASDHDYRSCLERPRVKSPFKESPCKESPCKKVKSMRPEDKKTLQVKPEQPTKNWKFNYLDRPNENFAMGGQIQNQVTSWGHESQNKSVEQEKKQEKSSLVGYLFEEEAERKAFDEFMANLHKENTLEKEQDKPKKDTPGIGYTIMKKMGYKDGKGLGKEEDGIVEPLLVTQLPKHMGLDDSILFLKHNSQSKLKGDGKAVSYDHKYLSAHERNRLNDRRGGAPPQNSRRGAPAQNNRGEGPPNAGCSANNNNDQHQRGGTQLPQHQNNKPPNRDGSGNPYQG